ncbi:MAG TPA: DNA-directed RNA polymerase subunit L [archaeon]|nr:DNA-directed RNA polymerase subunit L [archaeon]
MKLEVIKNEKDFAEFRMQGQRHTFPNLLKQKLLENKDVEFVSYILDHPTDESARFAIKTSGKSPKKILEDATKEIEEELEDFDKKVKKALK